MPGITVKHGQRLLKVLSQQQSTTPLSVLESRLGLSRRSIFYTIKQVNNQLSAYGLDEIENIRGAGYQLPSSTAHSLHQLDGSDQLAHDYIELFDNHFFFQALSQSDRRLLTMFALVSRSTTSLNQLSRYFSVSKTTVIKDLAALKSQWPAGVTVVNSNEGKSLQGNEDGQRRLIFTNFKRILTLCGSVADLTPNNHYVSQLHLLERITGNSFTEDAINTLANFIKWEIERLRTDPNCTLDPTTSNNYSLIMTWATSFLGDLGIHNTGEARFLAEIVNTQAFQHVNRQNPLINQLRPVTQQMIRRFDEIAGVNLAAVAGQLVDNLTIHLVSTYYRARYRIDYHNPLLTQIKNDYCETFELTKASVAPFEQFTNSKLSDDEIALITVYFSGALHAVNLNTQKHDGVLVVCSSGIGTSQLLIAQLRNHYPTVNFLGPYNTFQFENTDFKHVKLILSTVALPTNRPDCKVVTVPVLPGPADWPQIDQQLKLANLIQASVSHKVSVNTLMDIVSNYARIVEPDKLEQALQDYVYRDNQPQVLPTNSTTNSHAQFCKQTVDWTSAICFAFRDLISNGTVTDNYVERIIQLTKEHGDYMAIGNGVFLAHASANAGVNRLGFSYNYFTHPFNIEHSKKKLNFIVCIAPVDQEQHLKTLGVLLQCLQNDDWMAQLHHCQSQSEFAQVLQVGHLI